MKSAIEQRVALLLLLIGYIAFTVPCMVRYVWAALTTPTRALSIAVAYDRFLNAEANGNNKETISSRAYRAMTEGRRWGCWLCRVLDDIQPKHCEDSEGV